MDDKAMADETEKSCWWSKVARGCGDGRGEREAHQPRSMVPFCMVVLGLMGVLIGRVLNDSA